VPYFNMLVSFNGSDYYGFQYQPKLPTVQGEIEKVLSKITGRETRVIPAGRTDTGVHARCLPVIANIETHLDAVTLFKALNAVLPKSIRVLSIKESKDATFHPRFSAIKRKYCYYLSLIDDPFNELFYWRIRHKLDTCAIKNELPNLLGRRNFSSFTVGRYDNPYCTVYSIDFKELESGYALSITANRFLHKMVRSIVGYLYQIGRGEKTPVFLVAPPNGLFLVGVDYD
jgi:tRNA pseudouridine38-40 synthase